MNSGMKLKEETGVIVLLRRVSLSEDYFTRPADFVPERYPPLPSPHRRGTSHSAISPTLLYYSTSRRHSRSNSKYNTPEYL